MDAWAEKVDGALEAKDRKIAELRERLQRLERRSASGQFSPAFATKFSPQMICLAPPEL
jgi:hypothetical protein